jgi:hypothetical protein
VIDPAHLRIEPMASGHLTLILRERADWADFETFANDFVTMTGGRILCRADSPVERVWDVTIRGANLWLAFDDYEGRFEINAKDATGDDVVRALAAELHQQA